MIREKLQKIQVKRLVILNLPYFFIFYVADKGSWLYRHCLGESMVQRLGVMLVNFRLAFLSWLPSVALQDLAVGVLVAGALKLVVYYRSKNARSSDKVWSMDRPDGEIEKISNPSWIRSLKTMSSSQKRNV